MTATDTAVRLAPSLQLTGFADGDDRLTVEQQFVAAVDETAVVITVTG
jgi:hypothetical protein